MQLLIPAWGTCFWQQSPHISHVLLSRCPTNQLSRLTGWLNYLRLIAWLSLLETGPWPCLLLSLYLYTCVYLFLCFSLVFPSYVYIIYHIELAFVIFEEKLLSTDNGTLIDNFKSTQTISFKCIRACSHKKSIHLRIINIIQECIWVGVC